MKPVRMNFIDSSRAAIEDDGAWKLSLASGKYVRGKADDVESARVAVNEAHTEYVMKCWEKGNPEAGQNFCCPLVP